MPMLPRCQDSMPRRGRFSSHSPSKALEPTGHRPADAERTQQAPQAKPCLYTPNLTMQNALPVDAPGTTGWLPIHKHQNVPCHCRTGAAVGCRECSISVPPIEMRFRSKTDGYPKLAALLLNERKVSPETGTNINDGRQWDAWLI